MCINLTDMLCVHESVPGSEAAHGHTDLAIVLRFKEYAGQVEPKANKTDTRKARKAEIQE